MITIRNKEEMLEFAKANNGFAGFLKRFQKDEPLTIDDIRWASEQGLDLGYEIYLRAVSKYGLALEFVPKEHKTYELCFEAVKKNGWVLQYVPKNLRTYELCLAAVKEYLWAIEFVPKEHKQLIETDNLLTSNR